MANVLAQEKTLHNITLHLESPLQLNLEYRVLKPEEEELILDSAECLAQSFAGIDIAGRKIIEPMVSACGLSKHGMYQFVLAYIKAYVKDGLCYIARDRKTGKVVGVVACESFEPYVEASRFEGDLSPLNHIIDFLAEIDEKFIDTVEYRTGKKIGENEYVHAFMAGSRLRKFKRYVVANLVKLIMEEARSKGYKGIFAEATNKRSSKVLVDFHDFHLVYDKDKQPILKEYATSDIFNTIPEVVATDCRLLYKTLQNQDNI